MDYQFDNNNSNLAVFNYEGPVVTTSLAWKF